VSAARPPALSVVATSRNDDHGGNLLARMQIFVNGLAEQAGRFEFPVELVLVEWNPPADRAPLAEALEWPRSDRFCPRVITVSREVHMSLPNSERIPLFQMIGKNVGIRRASAPFVLATNIDILLSDELAAFLRDGLEPGAMYRTDRRDVQAALERTPQPTPAECRALPALRRHTRKGTVYPDGRQQPSRGRRHPLRDLPELSLNRLVLPRLHTSGCGDFTLASRTVWDEIRGYPEWPIFSWHLDGLPLFQAYAGGVRMIDLEDPRVAIHLEHSEGSGWTPEGAAALWRRLDEGGVPHLSTRDYLRHARRIVGSRRGFQPFNGPDWGLASLDLEGASK
jgi:hypothetical protein